jgi:chemotaxis protein methyltransferase CheR
MTPAAILSDIHFDDLKRYVLNTTGLSYYEDKNEDLAARLARRMNSLQAPDCIRYLNLLERGVAGGHEMESLVGELTIGETYFFRQVEHFDMLRSTIIPSLLEKNAPERRLRIWSAGCATGEEPYSIAILLEREFGSRLMGWDVSVLASDINNEFLTRAREGRYTEWAFRATPHDVRQQCFTRRGNAWILKPEYRRRVLFRRLNLASDESLAGLTGMFDLIICRNVMIYFGNDLIHHTVARFWDSLSPGGWLIVGHAEFNPDLFTQFTRVSVGDASVYQRPFPGMLAAEPQPWTYLPSLEPDLAHSKGIRSRKKSPPPAPPAAPIETPEITLQQVRDLADRGSWQAAANLGRQLTGSQPLSAPAHFTLGLILESMASPAEAERVLRRAIYLDRDFALAHYHLANCLQSEGKDAQARKSFQNVVQLLTSRTGSERVEHGDGMTVADLKEMAALHLEILEGRERTT